MYKERTVMTYELLIQAEIAAARDFGDLLDGNRCPSRLRYFDVENASISMPIPHSYSSNLEYRGELRAVEGTRKDNLP